MCVARIPEDTPPAGTWYHYEYHPWPNLFIWLGQVDGGDCTHCTLHENQRPMRWFGVLRWLLFERRRCPPPGRPLT
jgi:hypothetical protein